MGDLFLSLLRKAQEIVGSESIHLVLEEADLCDSPVNLMKKLVDLAISSSSILSVVRVQMPRKWFYRTDEMGGNSSVYIHKYTVILQANGTCACVREQDDRQHESDYGRTLCVKLGTYKEEGDTAVKIQWKRQAGCTSDPQEMRSGLEY